MVKDPEELFALRRFVFERDLITRRAYYLRVMRWPGALAIAIGLTYDQIVQLAGAPPWVRWLTGFCVSGAVMLSLMPGAWRRALDRAWNSLEA